MLRSLDSNIRAFVKFKNASERRICINWINFRGETIHYTNLEPGQYFSVNTFCTHPWTFVCPLTGERLQVNNKDVFQPEAWFKFINKTANGLVTVGRQEAIIQLPLQSLRDICLWRLLLLVQSKDDIYSLDIPKSLKADLLRVCRQSPRFPKDDDERGESFGNDLDE